jgi:hypothetical protein
VVAAFDVPFVVEGGRVRDQRAALVVCARLHTSNGHPRHRQVAVSRVGRWAGYPRRTTNTTDFPHPMAHLLHAIPSPPAAAASTPSPMSVPRERGEPPRCRAAVRQVVRTRRAQAVQG